MCIIKDLYDNKTSPYPKLGLSKTYRIKGSPPGIFLGYHSLHV